jgi:hypothetical protein
MIVPGPIVQLTIARKSLSSALEKVVMVDFVMMLYFGTIWNGGHSAQNLMIPFAF